MCKKFYYWCLFIMTAVIIDMICRESCAELRVTITVNPNKYEFSIGADPITLTADARGKNLRYKWEILKGDGDFVGNRNRSAIQYIPPEWITGTSSLTIIRITVWDKNSLEATEEVVFKIINPTFSPPMRSPRPSIPPTPNPRPTPPSQSTSMSPRAVVKSSSLGNAIKVALVGGLILAIAESGEEGNDLPPIPTATPTPTPTPTPIPQFAGTFKREYTRISTGGATIYYTDFIYLDQAGNSLIGTYEVNATYPNCCTAWLALPMTGTITGATSASLSRSSGNTRCDGSSGCWLKVSKGASNGHTAWLRNNGRTLNWWGADYYRQ